MVRMRGVTTMGVGWASGEASDLVEPPLNLVLAKYHVRVSKQSCKQGNRLILWGRWSTKIFFFHFFKFFSSF